MAPTNEGPPYVYWHDAAENLSTTAGAAEARAYLRKFASYHGGTIAIEYDPSGRFPTTARTTGELIAALDAADEGWMKASPFHVEVDPMRGNTPPSGGSIDTDE